MTLAGAGVVAVSAFLPWASFLGFTKYGIEGDGRVTVVIAVIGLALALARKLGWIVQLVLSAIVLLLSLADLSDAGSLAAIGLYLTFLGSAAWLIGSLMMRATRVPVAPLEKDPLEHADPV